MNQLREWLKAVAVMSLAACCLWGFWQVFTAPPRVIYGQGGIQADARLYCQQAGERAIQGIDPADRVAVVAARGGALQSCYSESAIDLPLLALQVLVAAGMAVGFWFLLGRM